MERHIALLVLVITAGDGVHDLVAVGAATLFPDLLVDLLQLSLHIIGGLIHGPLAAGHAVVGDLLGLLTEELGELVRSLLCSLLEGGLVLVAQLFPEGSACDEAAAGVAVVEFGDVGDDIQNALVGVIEGLRGAAAPCPARCCGKRGSRSGSRRSHVPDCTVHSYRYAPSGLVR